MQASSEAQYPSDETLRERIAASHRKTALGWDAKNETPVLDIRLQRPDFPPSRANAFWPQPEEEPDMESVVKEQIRCIHSQAFAADAAPHLMGNYGSRGTPMILSFFLGASPKFDENTVWYDPIISDIKDFHPVMDPANPWLEKSLRLFSEQTKALRCGVMPCIPGIGDYMTNLSGLRGVQELIYDMMDEPREIHRIREKMVPIFAQCFQSFYSRYPSLENGSATWMAWAPGPTYPVQCDFSTMMNPAQFKEFVMPEVEYLHEQIKFMCWHLDGPDEIRHLDALLASPHIKAIQWLPGAGQPPESDPQWRPIIERILGAGKAVHLAAYNIEQARTLLESYPVPGIYIRCWDAFNEENSAKVERYFGSPVW